MKKQLALLLTAAFLGALGSQAIDHWLVPAPAYADAALAGPFGQALLQEDGSLIVTARDTTLVLDPDGTVSVRAPESLIIGAADDVKIEGYRVKIDASSEVEIETSSMTVDVSDYELEASRIEIGQSSTDIKLADGSEYIALNDDGDIVKSQRVKAR